MAAREMNPTELQVRLVFNNGVLSKIQEQSGLKCSWVLLKPHFQTICDIVSYILHSFDLHDSCPHSIILFRDGFVLPEFESISILKDNDLISVKRKETRLLNASKAVQEATAYIKDGVVEKLPLPSGVKLLANEEFDKQTGVHQSESEKNEDGGVETRSPVQNDPNGDLASKKSKSSSKLEITNELDESKEANNQASAMPDKTKNVEHHLSDILLQLSNLTRQVNGAILRQKKKRVLNRSELDDAKKDELYDRQQPVKDTTIDTGPKKKIVASIISHHDEDSHRQQVEIVKDSEENQGANAFDVNPTENGTWEDHSGAKNVSDNQIVKEDVWEKIIEAVSAKKARLMAEDNWSKKETGVKWPSSCYNEVQDDAENVASKLSSQKPPTPGLANGKRDVWEEITEVALAKKAQLMLEDNWNKKETGAKWPSSLYNQVQDDAKKVASKLSNQKPPTPGLANGEKDVWEVISEAASAKKAQLMQKNNWKKKVMSSTLPSNGEKDVWEKIIEAASAKKAQLMQENNWSKKKTGAKWPPSWYYEVQDDAKKVASDPSIQKPPTPGLANGEKVFSEELTKATSAKKAQLMQEDRWSKEATAAAMVLQQLKQCHWPKAVNEQSQLAKPSESARSIRAQARARALAHPNPSRCPAKQGSDRKVPLIEPTMAGLRTHEAENGVG